MDFQIQYSLDVNDVSHSFGQTKVIDQISFTVGTGEFKVLLGPNGAGKSTLFSLITRLYHTKKGSISIQGNSLDKSPYLALRHVGVVFQYHLHSAGTRLCLSDSRNGLGQSLCAVLGSLCDPG